MSTVAAFDPFSSKSILKIQDLEPGFEDAWHGFQLDDPLSTAVFKLLETEKPKLPTLKSNTLNLQFDNTSLDSIDDDNPSLASPLPNSQQTADKHHKDRPDIDIWDDPTLFNKEPNRGLVSWDKFGSRGPWRLKACYVSEVSTETYDTILQQVWRKSNTSSLRFARRNQFHMSLTNLLLGRSSSYFGWNDQFSRFELLASNFTVKSHSPDVTNEICESFMDFGTIFRRLETFCQSSPNNATEQAVQTAVTQVLQGIKNYSATTSVEPATMLQLFDTKCKCSEVLETLQQLVECLRPSFSEPDILTAALSKLDDLWVSERRLHRVLGRVAERIVEPAIATTLSQIDLAPNPNRVSSAEPFLFASVLPLQNAMVRDIRECLAALISNTRPSGSTNIQLRPARTWLDVCDTQTGAENLEQRITYPSTSAEALPQVLNVSVTSPGLSQDSNNPFAIDFSFPAHLSTTKNPSTQDGSGIQYETVNWLQNIENDDPPQFSPSQAISLSLTPYLEVQSRSTSYELLRTLFLQQQLPAHLKILHSFSLLGSGTFATRLSIALFDPDQHSAEGRRKTGLTAGLRLEDRDAWPPASSELRLALMGLLNEPTSNKSTAESISFAIRDMSEEELDRCRDIHSIHALEFLRLVYAPPHSALELIITPAVLNDYDRIFSYLLMLLRAHALSQSLLAGNTTSTRQTLSKHYQKFCIEFHHFTSCVLTFALDVAIGVPWLSFMRLIEAVDGALRDNEYKRSMELIRSISHLRELHQHALDDMLKALLLKRKQTKIYELLCRVVGLCLQFSARSETQWLDSEIADYHRNFQQQMGSLLAQLKDISANAEDPALRRVEALALTLDLSGHYEPL